MHATLSNSDVQSPWRPMDLLRPSLVERCRILVIEDNRDSAESLRLLLGMMGFEVRVAFAGDNGVAVAGEWLPDIVLSDLGLPGLDGFAVARALRQHPSTAQARIIAISGYGDEAVKERCRAVGFDRHLTKPIDWAELHSLLAATARA